MQEGNLLEPLEGPVRDRLLAQYTAAGKRLLLFDYDGTLVPFAALPSGAVPGEALLTALQRVAAGSRNEVYIISGRDSDTLEAWLGHLPVGLVAEHGVKVRHRDGVWTVAAAARSQDWRPGVEEIMQQYADRYAGSFIERKEFSLVWHYRNVPETEGTDGAALLLQALQAHTAALPLHVLNGNKVIEVRVKGVTKGTAVDGLSAAGARDFILAAGDDVTDEDMFRRLAGHEAAFTVKVGQPPSAARYYLQDPAAVLHLLEELAERP